MQTHSKVEAHHPWVRAVPPNSITSAAYMVLYNHGDMEEQLLKVSTPVAEVSELHTVVKKDGAMSMQPVKHISVPAHGRQELKPGSFHIMLINLKQVPKVGDKVQLTLHFKHAGMLELSVPAKESQAKMNHDHSMEHSKHKMGSDG